MLHNMGVVRMLAGDEDEETVLDLFREAVSMKRDAFGPDHPEVAVSLVEIGVQCFALERNDDALAAFHEAKKIRMHSFGSDHPKVAAVLNNIGCVYFQQKSPVAALTSFQEARDMQQHAMERGGAKIDLDLLQVATTLCNLGYIKFHMKNYEEANTIFEDALLVRSTLIFYCCVSFVPFFKLSGGSLLYFLQKWGC